MLFSEELLARGHFLHSPSDTVPLATKTKNKAHEHSDRDDKTYQPPKKSNALDEEAPETIYGSDGEEISSETEYGHELVSILKPKWNLPNAEQRH